MKQMIWTCISLPILYKSWWAYGWQLERKVWKEKLVEERTVKLREPVEAVTLEQIPIATMSKEDFDKKWLYKPIRLRGLFDHDKETFI